MTLASHIESLLFVSSQPVSVSQLKKITDAKKSDIDAALKDIGEEYNPKKERGIVCMISGDKYQLVSHPDNAVIVKAFLKSDVTGELTDPALETLTIIAYRGPITKPELEQIRGVNCGLILRNLLIRGLIERTEVAKQMLPTYRVTHEFLKFLGASSVSSLPEYEKLSQHETLDEVLKSTEEE
ncbi:SMC-Scp complex subunit ScpB [bacterium CG10_46_32]|nr:MAG: SMC-Scp complex subunit ScpB [bacterium CG10_46_32]PIR56001.1 MAG: SMC-Scp complex subunit ScpB [Parcubacteria group bacterium CG10_big_fil_rev_8_21_14_0_10_46_32]